MKTILVTITLLVVITGCSTKKPAQQDPQEAPQARFQVELNGRPTIVTDEVDRELDQQRLLQYAKAGRERMEACQRLNATLGKLQNLGRQALKARLDEIVNEIKNEMAGCHGGRHYQQDLWRMSADAKSAGFVQLADRLTRLALEYEAHAVYDLRESFRISGRRYKQYRRDMESDFARGRPLDEMVVDYGISYDNDNHRRRPIYFE